MKFLGVLLIFGTLVFGASATTTDTAAEPDCSGKEAWPASMAFVHMKNADITDNDKLDFSKTAVKRLASKKWEGSLSSDLSNHIRREIGEEDRGDHRKLFIAHGVFDGRRGSLRRFATFE